MKLRNKVKVEFEGIVVGLKTDLYHEHNDVEVWVTVGTTKFLIKDIPEVFCHEHS